MGKFSDSLVEYSETIGVCPVEESRCVALKNYSKTNPVRVFGPGKLPKNLPIVSIGHLFDVLEIVRFQQAFIKAVESNERAGLLQTSDPQKYFAAVFGTMKGDHAPIISVIKQLILEEKNPLSNPADLSYLRYKNIGFAPYFPIPSNVLEEQRTMLIDTSDPQQKGKTENSDARPILPITTDLPQPKDYRDIWELLQDYLRSHSDPEVRKRYEEMQKTYAAVGRRLCCFTFRGDAGRSPEAILDAGGMLANTTRKDPKGAAAAAPVDDLLKNTAHEYLLGMQKDFLNLQVFLFSARGRAFISTTKSIAMAKCFTTYSENKTAPCPYYAKWGEQGGTCAYCYVVKCIGGFEIQSFDKDKKVVKPIAGTYTEQEITQLGAIWKENIFGFRRVWTTPRGQFFSGPIFVRNDFEKRYPNAFREIIELLSGKSQGKGSVIVGPMPQQISIDTIQNCYRPNSSDLEHPNQEQPTFDKTGWDEYYWPLKS